ncbi:endomucin isoform X2 [Fukomys damarensis]|uniref:endomucin isoform X2 n=1 Tax=Fukomys damarensis TaxID=885580 RepID=UPI0014557F7D|nr:endomucin isoform X2 [Fukomys damarensis]
MTWLPAATVLLLLLSGLCHGDATGAANTFTSGPAPATASSTKLSVSTPISISGVTEPTSETSPKAENQTSVKMTEISVGTQQPSPSPSEVSVLSSTLTTSGNISEFQGVEDGKNTSSLSISPSYSSIILPVVIVLIVITLSVFVLVGLYRMCWKNDPGTPENGSDQPQSDKESVKLLTVKTLSHESGEHCVAGKTKN